MVLTSTLHNHTNLCDGKDTPRQLIEASIQAGFTDVGISGHSYAPFDIAYSIRDEADYVRTVRAFQKEYAGVIRVWCGLEQDHFAATERREAYDYVIGSVHYIRDACNDRFYAVDAGADKLQSCISELFGGDALAMAAEYYRLVTETCLTYQPDIIGHFDLITKHREKTPVFNDQLPGYRRIALDALEKCAQSGGVFEVNTGAMARGWRTTPYPDRYLLEALKELKAPVTLSADCHDAQRLTQGLRAAADLLKDVGFKSVKVWHNGKFTDEEL